MNYTITGFSDEIASDFQEQLTRIKELNIDYIEIRGVNGKPITDYNLEEVLVFKEMLQKEGIKISAIGSPIGKINITDDFEPHFELFKHTVDIALLLETSYIRLFSFFVNEGEADDYREEVIRRMSAFCDYVKDKDVTLLHENEKEIYGDIPRRCLDLVNSIQSPKLKLIFDPANFVQCGVRPYEEGFELLSEHVIYYHIKDAFIDSGEVVPAGFGDGGLKDILKELETMNYNGFLSLEPHLGHFEGFDVLEGRENTHDIRNLKDKSDFSKFKLAYDSLMALIKEVEYE